MQNPVYKILDPDNLDTKPWCYNFWYLDTKPWTLDTKP